MLIHKYKYTHIILVGIDIDGTDSIGTAPVQGYEAYQRLLSEVQYLHQQLQEKKLNLELKEGELSNTHSKIENYEDELLIYQEENKELRLIIEGDVYSTIQNLENQLLMSTNKSHELKICYTALINFYAWINDKNNKSDNRIHEHPDIVNTNIQVPENPDNVSTDIRVLEGSNSRIPEYLDDDNVLDINELKGVIDITDSNTDSNIYDSNDESYNNYINKIEKENLLPLIHNIRKMTEEVVYNQEKEYKDIVVTKEKLRILLLSKEVIESTEFINDGVSTYNTNITPIRNNRSVDSKDNFTNTVVIPHSGQLFLCFFYHK